MRLELRQVNDKEHPNTVLGGDTVSMVSGERGRLMGGGRRTTGDRMTCNQRLR